MVFDQDPAENVPEGSGDIFMELCLYRWLKAVAFYLDHQWPTRNTSNKDTRVLQ